mgnify:CR=1 FL=1
MSLELKLLLKWYLKGLIITLIICSILALGLSFAGLVNLRKAFIFVFSAASFLLVVLAAIFSIQKAGLPREEATSDMPEEDRRYYSLMRKRLSTVVWTFVLLALSLFALMVIIIFS